MYGFNPDSLTRQGFDDYMYELAANNPRIKVLFPSNPRCHTLDSSLNRIPPIPGQRRNRMVNQFNQLNEL